jgi:hypothetical protein
MLRERHTQDSSHIWAVGRLGAEGTWQQGDVWGDALFMGEEDGCFHERKQWREDCLHGTQAVKYEVNLE